VAVTDGTSLFVATGNTFGARTWSDGEAVIRFAPDLHRSDNKRDFFAPSDWEALDARDAVRRRIGCRGRDDGTVGHSLHGELAADPAGRL
jgi:hypothetical protein